jgi:hypothetical protein
LSKRAAPTVPAPVPREQPPAGSASSAGVYRSQLRAFTAAAHAAQPQTAPGGHNNQPPDLRSPDTRDAAARRGTFSAPHVTVMKVRQPTPSASGMDWGEAGIEPGRSSP